MKKVLILILIALIADVNAQPRHHFRPEQADTITVSGKVIVDENFQNKKYFIDTNNDSQADYVLNFGPWWYTPDSSNAVRPNNGDEVTITGGEFQTGMYQFPSIIVYEINGNFWRDPFFALWNNMGNQGGMGHGRYHGGYGFGWLHDSLKAIELTGTAIVDTTFYMNHYYLDTDNDNIPNYFLNLGPFWYEPQSGALRPADGETINVRGGVIGIGSPLPRIVVYEINGLVWRDSTKFFPHLGGRWMHENDSTGRFHSSFDNDDFIEMHQGWNMGGGGGHMGGGHMYRDSLFCQIFESYPENMPMYKNNFFAGYEVNLFYPDGRNGMRNGEHGGRMNFGNNIKVQFHYTDEQLEYYNVSEDNITVMAWNSAANDWDNVTATVDKSNNLVNFSTEILSSFYVLGSQSVTSVEEKDYSPGQFVLEQNYPNPFNPYTSISYQLPSDGLVTLKVYDLQGQEVRTLVNEFKTSGSYNIRFDASSLTSGVYLYKLNANDFTAVKKLMLVK